MQFLPREVIPTDQAQQGDGGSTASIRCLNRPPSTTISPKPKSQLYRDLLAKALPSPLLHWYQENTISPSILVKCKQFTAPPPGNYCSRERPRLPVRSAYLHFVLQTQMQRFLVLAACEPFFLHKLIAKSRAERNSCCKSIYYFSSSRKSALICHKVRVSSVKAVAEQKHYFCSSGFAVRDAY